MVYHIYGFMILLLRYEFDIGFPQIFPTFAADTDFNAYFQALCFFCPINKSRHSPVVGVLLP
jgi:hypothetical protein